MTNGINNNDKSKQVQKTKSELDLHLLDQNLCSCHFPYIIAFKKIVSLTSVMKKYLVLSMCRSTATAFMVLDLPLR